MAIEPLLFIRLTAQETFNGDLLSACTDTQVQRFTCRLRGTMQSFGAAPSSFHKQSSEDEVMRTRRQRHRRRRRLLYSSSMSVVTLLWLGMVFLQTNPSYLVPVVKASGIQTTKRQLRGISSDSTTSSSRLVVVVANNDENKRQAKNETNVVVSNPPSLPLELASNHELCQGRPQQRQSSSSARGTGLVVVRPRRSKEWYDQCREHLQQADTVAPWNEWTMDEFLVFVQLQLQPQEEEEDAVQVPYLFSHLPLPLVVIFHDLACRCMHEPHMEATCCVGDRARIAAPRKYTTTDKMNASSSWTRVICQRVDHALDEMCLARERHDEL